MDTSPSNAAAKVLLLIQLLEQTRDALEYTDEYRRKAVSIIESHDKLMAQKEKENAKLKERLAESEHGTQMQISMERQLGAARAEIARLTTENVTLKQEIKGLTKRISNLSECKHQVTNLTNELAYLKQTIEKKDEDATQTRAELLAVSEANKQLQASLKMLSDRLVTLLAVSLNRGNEDGRNGASIDRQQLYRSLRCQALLLGDLSIHHIQNLQGCNRDKQAAPLMVFITTHSIAKQRILLHQLSTFLETTASEQVDKLNQLDLLLSAFTVNLVDYYLSAFLAPKNQDYYLLNPELNSAVLDTVSNFVHMLNGICGDLLAAFEEVIMLNSTELHAQFSFQSIKGLSMRLLPILFANMDLLEGLDTGIHMHASTMFTLLPIEQLIFAATSFTKRALSLRFKQPFVALTSKQFYHTIRLMCSENSILDSDGLNYELTVNQIDILLKTCLELLSKGAYSILETLINDTRAALCQFVANGMPTSNISQALHTDEAISEEILEQVRSNALQELIDYPQKHEELLAQLNLKDQALEELQREYIKLLGLLKLNSDRITITEEANIALRNALSAKLIT